MPPDSVESARHLDVGCKTIKWGMDFGCNIDDRVGDERPRKSASGRVLINLRVRFLLRIPC